MYALRADANALGGFLDAPFKKIIPTAAPSSLPAAGGFTSARVGAFDLDGIVSYSSAYTRVSGGLDHEHGSIFTQATAVVEDLNILEVVTAERIVAQVSITYPAGEPLRISLTGSRFDGLRIAGRSGALELNPALLRATLTAEEIYEAGREQVNNLIGAFKSNNQAQSWASQRHGWMSGESPPANGRAFASLVNGFERLDSQPSTGHIVDIPGFGRIFLGELVVSSDSVQLVSIRAELGCPTKGHVTGPCTGGGGSGPDR
jgi:hypothetical protein